MSLSHSCHPELQGGCTEDGERGREMEREKERERDAVMNMATGSAKLERTMRNAGRPLMVPR